MAQAMDLCIKVTCLSHLPAVVLLYIVCVRVCDVRLPCKTFKRGKKTYTLNADHLFLHA